MNTTRILPALLIIMMVISACAPSKKEQAYTAFNEGVSLSLSAGEYAQSRNMEKARELNVKAMEKYKEALRLDSTHRLVRSALGHSSYLQKDFAAGIYWFEQANKLDTPMAVNYREMGLCKINLGRIPEGQRDLERAFVMDGGKKIKDITVADLTDIGQLAFQYGEAYNAEGETAKGATYKRFSIGVLLTAFTIDTTKKEIAGMIADYAENIGEKPTADKYRAIAGTPVSQ